MPSDVHPNSLAALDDTKWKPGQSGNPRGGSRKATQRKFLRELFAEGLGEYLPPAVREKLANLSQEDREHAEKQIAALTFGDVIKLRVLLSAAIGSPAESAKAIDQILSGEPKSLTIDMNAAASVQIASEPKRLDEVKAILDEVDR